MLNMFLINKSHAPGCCCSRLRNEFFNSSIACSPFKFIFDCEDDIDEDEGGILRYLLDNCANIGARMFK